MKKFIDLKDVKVENYYEKKYYLSFVLLTGNKTFKFIYDINSKVKKHRINNMNMMLYKKDPIEKMIKYIFKNDSLKYRENFSNSFFAGKLISMINKKFY